MKHIGLAALVALFCSGCIEVSDGETSGIVTKISKTGLICKTNEGRMSVGYTRDGVGTVSKEEFHFTVEDQSVFDQIRLAIDSGKPMKLFYKSEFITFCRSESDHFVYKVQAI